MLLITDAGFVEILREPQFTQHFTVRAETEAALQPLIARTYCKHIRHDPHATFSFTAYAYEDEVIAAFKIGHSSWTVTQLPQDISPCPSGYFTYSTNHEPGVWESRYVWHEMESPNYLDYLDDYAGDWPEFRYYPVYAYPDEVFGKSESGQEDSD